MIGCIRCGAATGGIGTDGRCASCDGRMAAAIAGVRHDLGAAAAEPGLAVTAAWPGCLTRREAECADLLCRGFVRESVIVRMGGIAAKTYDTYRGSILKKLGLANTVQLLRFALARGLVDPPERVTADPITGEPIAEGAAA